MEKKSFLKPVVEIVWFETADVITTSGEPTAIDPGIDDWKPGGGGSIDVGI